MTLVGGPDETEIGWGKECERVIWNIKLEVELEGCSPAEWQQTFSNWHLTFFAAAL